MANASTIITVDFSDVKESSGINPKAQPEGDYLMRIVKAELTKTKTGDPMALILFQDANLRSAVYPYYCTFATNMLWKIRNTFIAAGLPVPKGKGKLDVAKLVNKEVGVTLEDDEYDGKPKSVISGVFHKDELEPVESEDDDFEEEEEEEEAPAPAKKRKAAPAPVEEDDEEDDEEEEPEEKPVSKRVAARRAAKAKAEEVEEDDAEEDDEEEAPAPKRKAKAKAPVEEDDDDDLELDDI